MRNHEQGAVDAPVRPTPVPDEAAAPARAAGPAPRDLPTFAVLLALSAVTSVLVVPYGLSVLPPGGAGPPVWVFVVGALVEAVVLTVLLGGAGLWLGPRIGLGAPDLQAVVHRHAGAGRRVRAALPLATGLGAASGLALFALGSALPLPSTTDVAMPPAWQGLLGAVSAASTRRSSSGSGS